MQDLGKVSSWQLYGFWKNLSYGLLMLVATIALSKVLPFYISPVIALICAGILYTRLYNERMKSEGACLIMTYLFFICLLTFAFLTIILNFIYIIELANLPPELIFFTHPFIPSLILAPVCLITTTIIYLRRKSLRINMVSKLTRGNSFERGRSAAILDYEASFQLRNLIILFGILTAILWSYYLIFYVNINVNSRDWYVFTWFTIIVFLFDEVYFAFRYYNLYLTLKSNNEIITPDELNDMSAKTYLRYYVICGDDVYIDESYNKDLGKEVLDTPFFTMRPMNGIMRGEVKNIIERMTGQKNGELRYFYGRRSVELRNHSMLRYFYFLPGKISDYPSLSTKGRWISFSEIKHIYTFNPSMMASRAVTDLSRLATIILTWKTYDENGIRRNRIKSYKPSFDLTDVRNSNLDFQDDKWIRISMFNSDTRLFRLKRWWRRISGQFKAFER